jgi:D-serine deaminase-like pyridoxal phosphate-dependent protein
VDQISVGGTPTAAAVHEVGGVTELRAGTYVYGDRTCIANGSVALGDCALTVRATVVSSPTEKRIVLDAGSKSLSTDPGVVPEGGFGMIVEWPGAAIYELHEEHALVDMGAHQWRPRIGDQVSVIPNHVCVTVNLHDEALVHRAGQLVDRWPIAARGRVQ